jgi:3'(2'), 5'-bisphosphate nucleotidase
VVYAPVSGVLYFADRSIGSFKLVDPGSRTPGAGGTEAETAEALLQAAQALPRRRSLELDGRHRHPRIIVMASRSHRGPAFESYVESLREHAERIEIRSLGSALKPCVVAEGAADMYPRFGRTMEWDTAAAHAVVQGVGKRMIAFETGQELTYNKRELVNPSFLVL